MEIAFGTTTSLRAWRQAKRSQLLMIGSVKWEERRGNGAAMEGVDRPESGDFSLL
jgi:hypothetical protein